MSQQSQTRYVRVAELEIDASQIDAIAAAAREVGDASVRGEAGCLALYAVTETDNPGRVLVLEIYSDAAAYEGHVRTAHFEKFRSTTNAMVKSRKLIDATPVSFATKPGVTP